MEQERAKPGEHLSSKLSFRRQILHLEKTRPGTTRVSKFFDKARHCRTTEQQPRHPLGLLPHWSSIGGIRQSQLLVTRRGSMETQQITITVY